LKNLTIENFEKLKNSKFLMTKKLTYSKIQNFEKLKNSRFIKYKNSKF